MTPRSLRKGSDGGIYRQLAMPVGFLVWLSSLVVVPYVLTKLGLAETPTVVISMGVFFAPVFLVIALRGGSEREGRARRSAGPLVCFSMVFFAGAIVASQAVRDNTLWIVLLFVGVLFASMAVAVARSSRHQLDHHNHARIRSHHG